MIVFNYFFKILKQYKVMIILYTAILVIFGAFSLNTNDTGTDFTITKPDICIINQDKDSGITQGLTQYLTENANRKDIKQEEEALSDALFYREVSYIITIPENYQTDWLAGKEPKLIIQSNGDYEASLAEMLTNNYLQTADTYRKSNLEEDQIIEKTKQALDQKINIEMTSNLNNNGLSQANFYFNFANYSILAICIFVVGMVMSSFRKEMIKKRTMVSPMKPKNYNRANFLGIIVLGVALWAVYLVISMILVKDVMFTLHGLYYAINSFIFTICALSIAFLIGSILQNKEAISGVANVISLGSAFLCGSFVPVEWLPDSILTIVHILPSYWYIQNNEYIKTMEEITWESTQPFLMNIGVIILFIIGFLLVTNWFSKRKK
jgi:ABC-2 type transport system permease protein